MKVRTKIFQLIACIILLAIAVTFQIYHKKKVKNENIEILKNPKYSIGIVTDFQPEKKYYKRYRHSSVKFFFFVENMKFSIYHTNWKNIPEKGIHIGEKFLVVYFKKDPKKCIMLFDKPIKDSLDYRNYMKDIKNGKRIKLDKK